MILYLYSLCNNCYFLLQFKTVMVKNLLIQDGACTRYYSNCYYTVVQRGYVGVYSTQVHSPSYACTLCVAIGALLLSLLQPCSIAFLHPFHTSSNMCRQFQYCGYCSSTIIFSSYSSLRGRPAEREIGSGSGHTSSQADDTFWELEGEAIGGGRCCEGEAFGGGRNC